MFGKKKKEEIIIEDDEKFIIPQVYRPNEHLRKANEFKPSKVASPIFGSRVADRQAYIDNAGSRDLALDYDYARKDEDKHMTKEDLIKKYGNEYYEFDILDNNKARELAGGGYEDRLEETEAELKEKDKLNEEAPKEMFGGMMSSFDDLDELEKAPDVDDPNAEFKINIDFDQIEEDQKEFDTFETNMPKPEQVNIPSFLAGKSNPKAKVVEEEQKEFSFDKPEMTEDFSFGDIPNMASPDIEFEESEKKPAYSNPAVDRNISIEDAIRLSDNGRRVPVAEESKPVEQKPIQESKPSMPEVTKKVDKKPEVAVDFDKYKNYQVPWKKLFPPSMTAADMHPAWLEEKKNIINETLKSFSIDGEVINYTKGPAFTLYEIMLAPGVNVKKINQITDNLQMNLQVKSIRILSPIPGKNTIGVEAPNDKADVVKFGDILSDEYFNDGKPLKVALGKNIDGSPVFQDITSMPHALIAGATQSGKSVCINTILVSLLAKNSPENLKLILVDPKKVELTFYENIPHLATPVIDDPSEAAEALKWACAEMDRRYDVLARNRVRKISDYLEKRKQIPTMEPMPYIVIIVDEFNDLVMQCGQDVNDCIVRLAQKARAAGMHVILATQRPTVDVVNGTIKANIPCRIAFRVASSTDSSTILDETGAESLLGRGDMLIKNDNAPIRAQGAYISDDEIGSICDYLCQKYQPDYIFTHDDLRASISRSQSSQGGGAKDASGEDDELLFAIAEFCVAGNSCSINAIQNNFGLGFNRAQRIVQLLEERQIVSPKCGTKPREILVDDYKLREIFGVNE
ncbi:MAG: DNA translocase FtsK [Acholeplasmatales bacterium]|nr:DNA translocase FtsK [Acholeplasmatales bacterium]